MKISSLLLMGFLAGSSMLSAAEPLTLKLWPKGAPEKAGFKIEAEKEVPKKNENDVVRITNVSDPTLTVYQAKNPTGAAVIVYPGGGYNILAYEHEGTQVCEWLNELGVSAILVKYRVPRRDEENPSIEPLQDAQRAMGIVRKNAKAWGIDPQKIGVLGFSAGGHLAIMASLHANERTYTQDPNLDVEDATPNFAIPVYPAYLTEKDNDYQLKAEIAVTKDAPQVCLIHAHDDRITATGSSLLYNEYHKHKIPAELHIFHKGGHGYGMRKGELPVNAWPERVAAWLKVNGLAH